MPALREAPFASEVPLLPVIERAKAMLEKESVRHIGTSPRNSRREIKLALTDFKTGNIRIVSGVESGGKLSLDDPSIRFGLDWWNGFNSSISILHPATTGVVALLYPLSPERQRFHKQDAVIYTPFSSALLQTELVEAGRKYLIEKISHARRELAQVPSRVFPGISVGDSNAFSDDDYFDLVLSEHMDPGRFHAIISGTADLSKEQQRQLMLLAARILVIVGANQEDAYRFTGSYAGAQGIAQFTRMGMEVVWKNYPSADVPRDFREAATVHLNAIKAQMCLMDHDLANLIQTYAPLAGSGYEKYAAAAAYNGGLRRVRYGLGQFGREWLYPRARLAGLKEKRRLTAKERREVRWLTANRDHETFIYLNKLNLLDQSPLRTAWNTPDRLTLVLHTLLFSTPGE